MLLIEAIELPMGQTEAAIGKSVIPVDGLSIWRAAFGGSRLAGSENAQRALKPLIINHVALAQPFKFFGLALDISLAD